MMDATPANAKAHSYKSLLDFTVRRLPGFVSFVFSMLVSRQLTGFPFYGGVWFLTGQVLLLCAEAYYRMFQALFSKKRRAHYAVCAVLAGLFCTAATVLFIKSLQPGQALVLLAFVANQLVGMALLEGAVLLPLSESRKFIVNLAFFTAVSAAALLFCRFAAGVPVPWLMALYDGLILALLCLKAALRLRGRDEPLPGAAPVPLDEMEGIYAYRQYRRMSANALISIEVSVMLLASYVLALPENSDTEALMVAARLLALFSVSIWACRLLLNHSRLAALGGDIAFLFFALLWIFISFYTLYHPAVMDEQVVILPIVLISLCMAALSAVLLNMDRYMVIIGELGLTSMDHGHYALFKNASYHLGAVMSRLVFLALIAAVSVLYGGSSRDEFAAAAMLNRNKLIIIPLVFLVPAALSALQQPLTRYYEQKLSRYWLQKLSGKVSRALEQKLILSLVKKSGKRIGIRLLRAAVKPFVTLRRIGVEHVNPRQFPSVFVCNHAEIFGPIAATVNISFFNRPWIIQEMLDGEKIAAHLQTGFDHYGWVPRPIRRRLGRFFGPILLWVMQSMDPIPVFRNSIKDITQTIGLSVEALEADDNILIFPENPFSTDNRYVIDGVGEFFEGFVHIARNYCRSTGRPLVFYSVYADARSRTITFSGGVTFDVAAPFGQERERVCAFLHDEMVRMYHQRRS